jgi:cation transport ATPase
MDRVYHLQRSTLVISLTSLALLSGLGIACIVALADAERPVDDLSWLAVPGIVFVVVIPGFFILLSCYLLFAYFRHSLTIEGGRVLSVGMVRSTCLELDTVLDARWRRYGGYGRLGLRTASEKLAIDFGDYRPEQARELIRFFRHRLPQDIQQGWERYWEFYWRRFDEPDPARREHFALETRWLRRRMLLWVSLGTGLCASLGLALWWWTGDAQSLRGIVLSLLFWPVVWLIRADRGKIAEKVPEQLSANAAVIVGLILLGLTLTVVLAFAAFAIPGGQTTYGIGVLGSLLLILLGVAIEHRRIERSRDEAARLAEIEYMGAPNDPGQD